jgi:hypothetical protein
MNAKYPHYYDMGEGNGARFYRVKSPKMRPYFLLHSGYWADSMSYPSEKHIRRIAFAKQISPATVKRRANKAHYQSFLV